MAYFEVNKTIVIGIILALIGMGIAVLIINTWMQVAGVLMAMAGAVIVFRRRK